MPRSCYVVLFLALVACGCSCRATGAKVVPGPAAAPFAAVEQALIARTVEPFPESGAFRKGRLRQAVVYDGIPCDHWLHLYENGVLHGCRLASPTTVQGHLLPAGAQLWFDSNGFLESCWLGTNTLIDGRLCRGRGKISTGFYPSGRLRSFFPPAALQIDGVPCRASVFAPVTLYEDGHLRRCTLDSEYRSGSNTLPAGSPVLRDESGVVRVVE
ncbi:MAG: hypothetical protein AAF581_18350 [Planctomycetota bacterium]